VEITPRLIAAVILFLLGTTFLWLTSSFLGSDAKAEGNLWGVVQVLAFATIIGFAIAAYGLWQGNLPWEPIAAVSALVGLGTSAAYWLAVRDVPNAANVTSNLLIHGFIGVVVLVFAYLPAAHDWLIAWIK
jgi:hypothetical protein